MHAICRLTFADATTHVT